MWNLRVTVFRLCQRQGQSYQETTGINSNIWQTFKMPNNVGLHVSRGDDDAGEVFKTKEGSHTWNLCKPFPQTLLVSELKWLTEMRSSIFIRKRDIKNDIENCMINPNIFMLLHFRHRLIIYQAGLGDRESCKQFYTRTFANVQSEICQHNQRLHLNQYNSSISDKCGLITLQQKLRAKIPLIRQKNHL